MHPKPRSPARVPGYLESISVLTKAALLTMVFEVPLLLDSAAFKG